MQQEKITTLLREIMQVQLELKITKKEIRGQEKITEEEFLELEKAARDLRDQVKAYKENYKSELMGDKDYVELLNEKMQLEEKLALQNKDLFAILSGLPPKSVNFKLNLEEGSDHNVDIRSEMRLYINGREEKPRTIS